MDKEERERMRVHLGRYRLICKEIEARERHLKEWMEELYNPLRAMRTDRVPGKRGGVWDQTFETVAQLEQAWATGVRELQQRIEELKQARDDIERAVDCLDGYERCVLYYRYILGVRWIDMPQYMDYDQRQCQRIETRAIDKLINMSYNV